MWTKLVNWMLRPTWIVGQDEEFESQLGFKIWGVCFYYYKWSTPIATKGKHRIILKREFGESIRSKVDENG
jgi:hypothetical protein